MLPEQTHTWLQILGKHGGLSLIQNRTLHSPSSKQLLQVSHQQKHKCLEYVKISAVYEKKHVSLLSDCAGLSVFVNSPLHLKIGHLDFFAVSPRFFSCDRLLGSPMVEIRQDKVYGSHNGEVVASRNGRTVKDNKTNEKNKYKKTISYMHDIQ